MARITIEDCLDRVDNMYELVLVAAKRVRQIYKGDDPLIKSKNRNVVVALREIAAGKVAPANPLGNKGSEIQHTTPAHTNNNNTDDEAVTTATNL